MDGRKKSTVIEGDKNHLQKSKSDVVNGLEKSRFYDEVMAKTKNGLELGLQ